MKNIREKVYGFKTKNKEGFVQSEIDTLLKDYPDINMDKFNSALMGTTCMRINDETVIYHCDIDKALHRGVENRNLRSWCYSIVLMCYNAGITVRWGLNAPRFHLTINFIRCR